MNNVRPRLTMMIEEQNQKAHRNTLQVLSQTGVRVDSPSIPGLLEQNTRHVTINSINYR